MHNRLPDAVVIDLGNGMREVRITPEIEHLAHFLRQKKVKPKVLNRVLRLNANIRPGEAIRGWRPPDEHFGLMMRGNFIRKGAAIKTYGRRAVEMVPLNRQAKRGKRVWLKREAVEAAAKLLDIGAAA